MAASGRQNALTKLGRCWPSIMRFGIIVFPGTWSDRDCHHAIETTLDVSADYLWHKDITSPLNNYDCIVLPGGFSYGDYLRAGALAALSPIMEPIRRYAADGGLVFGICNGFQILCEAGLLPGVLVRNSHLEYRCQWAHLRVEREDTAFTRASKSGDVLRIPISHGEGSYYADAETLKGLEDSGQVLFRYSSPVGDVTDAFNPNGSINNIAGIINQKGNVLGMMPHPERCCEALLGGTNGSSLFRSIFESHNPRIG